MKKIIIAFGAFSALMLAGVLGIGCGGSKCQQLDDAIQQKYEDCGLTPPTEAGASTECTDSLAKVDECYIPCYQNMQCILLSDPTSAEAAKPGGAAETFNKCLLACSKK